MTAGFRAIVEDDKTGQPRMLYVRRRKPYPDGSGIHEWEEADTKPAVWVDGLWCRIPGYPVEHDEADILGIVG